MSTILLAVHLSLPKLRQGDDRQPVGDEEIRLREAPHARRRADAGLRLQEDPVIELHEEVGGKLAEVERTGRGGTPDAVDAAEIYRRERTILVTKETRDVHERAGRN